MIIAMKSWLKLGVLVLLLGTMGSCKKYLNVPPIDVLSGNNFWETRQDAEAAVSGAYRLMENKITFSTLYNDGDFRAGNWNWFRKLNFATLAKNDLLSPDLNYQDNTADPKLNWKSFYEAIAAANLCIARIPDVPDPSFSTTEKRQLVGEARFIRDFIYFLMVRLYGDVPLQYSPYQISKRPRMDMLQVLDTCIADLDRHKDDLPSTYVDPTNRAVRATKGAALTLMAHMYAWKAGFAADGQLQYWEKVADLCKQVMDLGVYELLPYTDAETMHEIFKGRSTEGIFELSLDANYGTQSHTIISQWTLHEPYIHSDPNQYGGFASEITPKAAMLDKLYPSGAPDKRFDLWFDDPYCSQNPQSAMFLKFATISSAQSRDFDANYIFFRYAGVVLLRAEALAELGNNGEAINLLNLIRKRAGAPDYAGGNGQALKDAIFLEREKELMGEGWLWYDLVRTKRVMDQQWTENYLTPREFEARAWTWPIPSTAIHNNPLVKQTPYWLSGG